VGSDWHEIKPFVEPIVAEIDQPDVEWLMRCQVEIGGAGQEHVSATYLYDHASGPRNAELLRLAARLLQQAAERQDGR
jgi:hypothetical protein